jgi:poly(hydroxyalkanoate) depolymerase family esterase
MMQAAARSGAGANRWTRLREVTGFGVNPGNLRMLTYVPDELPESAALVVVLHGCMQTAAGYDRGAGWSTLADRYGFALIFPEQQRANNPRCCFTWYQLGDIERGRGEPQSIREMIEQMVLDRDIDRRRIFVTGFSAGAAMASVMLATYPDVFAGGGIIAGVPYGAATNVQQAFECMFQGRGRPPKEWGDHVRAASPHRGPWPKVSVWQGGADRTVRPTNADEIVKQWTDVHGLALAPSYADTVNGFARRVWCDRKGRDVIECYSIGGMGHGAPLATGDGDDRCGAAGPFLLNVGISSSFHIARFWGIATEKAAAARRHLAPKQPVIAGADEDGRWDEAALAAGDGGADDKAGRGVRRVIKRALRAIGLMRTG